MKEKPGDIERLRHMVKAIDKIFEFTKQMNFDDFLASEVAQFAIIKNFEILGEAAYQISKPVKTELEDIEWAKIQAMRHILVHDYYTVNLELLWSTKENKLPDLRLKLSIALDRKE